MGHRHPGRLYNAEVEHPRARWLLRAELANCSVCRIAGDREALADPCPGGMFDSLLQGFVLARTARWLSPQHRPTFPAAVYTLAPADERAAWTIPTRECLKMCVVRGSAGSTVDTTAVLAELTLMSHRHRALVLDDVIDGLTESEGE
ncbi:hypothetical protein RIF23_07965 [Lipingzhangella sp. LS1_29]|uniref:Uncharacterized protein n=1 Tax=Lipingzhangella rawalii TaxID=2055835 RepID=A0ABU2H4K3_9ACTN|nr:hypothetical protein [Lipingzhangella rawalii]MDS1270228.1 hypothetical protein [Lipingzhangella rawalii]